MISLVGGELYQWDTGRIVRVVPDENVKVHEVHFSTKRMDYAYVLKTYIVDGVTYCAIPNIILQQSNRILCYEVCENSDGEETIANTYFDIIKRNRPEDYVYTEQDHFTIQALSNRVDKLEESSHTHSNKTELDTITEEDLETWRSPNSSAITGGAQVGTLFEDLEVTTTLAEDASEWTSASSKPFKCTFRPSPGQMVVVKVKDLDVDTITTAKIPPTGYPLGQTIIGNYSVVDSRLQSWYNNADSVPPTPNDLQANSCLVFEDQYYDSEHLAPSLPTCILYTKTPGTYKVTVTTLKHSIGPESVMKMYDVRPSTFVEYGTYANWKDLTKSGKYGLWEVNIKKTNYYNGVYLKEINGTKYVYVYHSEQKANPDGGFTTIEHTLTYDTSTETVICSDTSINPETDVIISVHLDQVISAVPDSATSLGKPSADKVGKMLTTVDLGEGVIDNKWQSRRYEYQWVDAPKAGSADAVKYTEQTLTDDQKTQARTNIGAISVDELPVASYLTKGVGYVGFESSGSDTNDFDYDLHEAIGIDNEKFCYTPAIRGNFDTKLSVDFLKKNLRYSGGHAKSYLFGSADEDIANSLQLINKDFPITVTVMNSDYNSPPTWYYLMVTARGRTGKFALKATESVISSAEPYTSFIDPERKELPPTNDYVVGNVDENGNLWSYRTLNSFAKHNVFSKDTVLYQMTGDKSIVYIFGSGDETVSSLNLTASNYPVVVTYTGYEIMNSKPKFSYIITTADGKKGSFTWFVKDNNPSPITWTFEGDGGGGGGNPLFIITPTYNEDTKTWSTDRTWDEVKAAVAKSEKPNDYSINLWGTLLSPYGLLVDRNGSGEIAGVQMRWTIASPMVVDINEMPDGFGNGLVPAISYVDMIYEASSSGIDFIYAESGEIPQAIIKSVLISKYDDGALACDPPHAVELYGGFLTTEQPDKAQFICPLYYNGETYHYETGEKDSSNIVSLYFSTVSNGVYKRLKITQGQNGASDTVVMDREIKLNNVDPYRTKQVAVSGTFSNISGVSNDLYIIDRNVFMSLCDGVDSVYLTIGVGREYELTPGGSTDGIYSLMYNGKAAITLNARGTSNRLDFSSPFNTEPEGTEFGIYAMRFNNAILPRIPVDGTTIKFNDQGQLTLALSNANGVSF